jgi:hypothetical protein
MNRSLGNILSTALVWLFFVIPGTIFRVEIEEYWNGTIQPFIEANSWSGVATMFSYIPTFWGGVVSTLLLLLVVDRCRLFIGRRWPISQRSPIADVVVEADVPRISFTHDIAHLLHISDDATGEPKVLVRPLFSPADQSFEDVEIAVEEAYVLEQGAYDRVSSERFELSWEGHPSLKRKPRIQTPQKFAIIAVWPERPSQKEPQRPTARIHSDTNYGTWNGELEPFGLYKFRLALTSSNRPRQDFTVYLSWFGSLETLVVESENGWRE